MVKDFGSSVGSTFKGGFERRYWKGLEGIGREMNLRLRLRK
jgi:hypothetical protein